MKTNPLLRRTLLIGIKFKTKVFVYEKLERGGKYKVQGKFYPPLPAMNKGTFDYEKNNKSQGIYLLGKINSYEKISDSRGLYKFSNFIPW